MYNDIKEGKTRTELLGNRSNDDGKVINDGGDAAASAAGEDVGTLSEGGGEHGGGSAESKGREDSEGLEGEHYEMSVGWFG